MEVKALSKHDFRAMDEGVEETKMYKDHIGSISVYGKAHVFDLKYKGK